MRTKDELFRAAQREVAARRQQAVMPVSYTHLDVYKRQANAQPLRFFARKRKKAAPFYTVRRLFCKSEDFFSGIVP